MKFSSALPEPTIYITLNNMIKRITTITAIIAGLAVIIWAFMPEPLAVDVATTSRTNFQLSVEEDGKTRAKDIYVISSPVRGNLLRVAHKAGDSIKKGDLLVTIVPATSQLLDVRQELQLQETLGTAKASLLKAQVMESRAKAAYATAQSELKRNKALAKKGFVSESILEQKQLDVDLKERESESSKHNVEAAVHDVKRAQYAFQHYKDAYKPQINKGNALSIRSPIDGKIIKMQRESAGAIMGGATILEVADVSNIEIVVDILSTDAIKIKPGDKAYIKRWGRADPLQGAVRLVEPGGFTKISALGVEEQRVNIIIDITSPKEQWHNLGSGFQVDAQIIISEQPDQLVIPVSALFRDGNQWAVFVLNNGVANKKNITINGRNAQYAAIKSGLNESEQVIIYPGDRIKDGVRVKVRQP